MPRQQVSYKLQPEYVALVKARARALSRSEGFVIEQAIFQMADGVLEECPPGRRLEDEPADLERDDHGGE